MIADSPLNYGELEKASRMLLSFGIVRYPRLVYIFKSNDKGIKVKIKWLCINKHNHFTKTGALFCCQLKDIK